MRIDFVRLLIGASSACLSAAAYADVVTSQNETVSIFEFRPPLTNENGLIEGQTFSLVFLQTLDNIGVPTVVEQVIVNCRIPAEFCSGPEGIASLPSTSARPGLAEFRLATAGSDEASAQMRVDGVGTVSNPSNRTHLLMNSMVSDDWQLLEVNAPPGVPLPATVDIDMTYTLIAAVSNSTNASAIGLVYGMGASIQMFDLESYSPDGTGRATVFRPFSQRASVTNTVASERLIDQTVTLQLAPNRPYLLNLRTDGLSTTNVAPFAANIDVTSIDHDASAFADPVFAVNPGWAAANRPIAQQIVINRVLNSTPIDVDVWPLVPPRYNLVNVRSNGLLPVAILTSADVKATDIDVDSLRFGRLQARPRSVPRAHLIDLNWDGKRDLLVYFRTNETGIACGDTEARLVGLTKGGTHVAGADVVVPVPCR